MRLSDNVLRRMIQIFQEAILTGEECTDKLRDVKVNVSDGIVELDLEYVEAVKNDYAARIVGNNADQ